MAVKKITKNKYFLKDGTPVCGVTTILQELAKPALVPWAYKCGVEGTPHDEVRDNRARIGTLTHQYIEIFLKGDTILELEEEKCSAEEIATAKICVEPFKKWWASLDNPIIIASEIPLVSEQYRFGGTFDLLLGLGGKVYLCDYKTSKQCYDEHKIQQCAYNLLASENNMHIDGIKIIQVNELSPVAKITDIDNDHIPYYTTMFMGALQIHQTKDDLHEYKEAMKKFNHPLFGILHLFKEEEDTQCQN